jgi:hypothetical protein
MTTPFQLVMAGGVTSMQVLPGSLNAIGNAEDPFSRSSVHF